MLSNNEIYRAFPEIKSLVVELSEEGVPVSKLSETIDMPASVIYRWRKNAMVRRLLMQNSENLRARSDIIRKLELLRHTELVEDEFKDPHGCGDTDMAEA